MGVSALGERQVLQLWNSVVLFALNRRLGGHCILPAKAVGSPRAPIVDSYQPTLTPVERGDQGATRSPSWARQTSARPALTAVSRGGGRGVQCPFARPREKVSIREEELPKCIGVFR